MKKGFTLIELLVVITILAVLAGAALPYVQNYVEEARIAKAKTDLEEVARALAVYETREGEYQKGTVEDLTGRYLNKAPIDPWGSQYTVATLSGIVYSKGPDRLEGGANDLDNINVPYQPPLALVSAKWVDKNQSGAVDIQNVEDELVLTFSRRLSTLVAAFQNAGNINNLFEIKVNGTAVANVTTVIDPASATIVGGKTVVYKLVGPGVFTPGRDSVNVKNNHDTIKDSATPANNAISNQDVKILPQ